MVLLDIKVFYMFLVLSHCNIIDICVRYVLMIFGFVGSDLYLEWLLAVAFVGGIAAPLNYRWVYSVNSLKIFSFYICLVYLFS